MTTLKSIVSETLAELRLDSYNYDFWHQNIKYFLNKKHLLNFINKQIAPQLGNVASEVKSYADEVKKTKVHNISHFSAWLMIL